MQNERKHSCCFIGVKLDNINRKIIMKRIKLAENEDIDKIEFKDGSFVKCSPQKCEPLIVTEDGMVIHDPEDNKQLLECKEHLKKINNELEKGREKLLKNSAIERTKFRELMEKINHGNGK